MNSLLEGLDNPEEAVDVKHLQEGVSHSVKRLTRWTARVDTMSSITDCNMVDAFEESKILIELLKEKRRGVFRTLSLKIADALDIDLTPRRGVGRQTHRENASVGITPEQHWRINLTMSSMKWNDGFRLK